MPRLFPVVLAVLLPGLLAGCVESGVHYDVPGSAELLFTIDGAGNRVQFSPDGFMLLTTGDNDQKLKSSGASLPRLWSASNGAHLRDLRLEDLDPNANQHHLRARFHRDGSVIARGWYQQGSDDAVHILTRWDAQDGAQLRRAFLERTGRLVSLAVSPDGLYIAIAAPNRDIKIYSASDFRLHSEFEPDFNDNPIGSDINWSPNSTKIMAEGRFVVTIFQPNPFARNLPQEISSSAFIGDEHLLFADAVGILHLIDQRSFADNGTFVSPSDDLVKTIAVASDGSLFAVAGDGSENNGDNDYITVRVHRVFNGEVIAELRLPRVPVTEMSFDNKADKLAIANADNNIMVFNISPNK